MLVQLNKCVALICKGGIVVINFFKYGSSKGHLFVLS